jgi:hypothetical protein
MRRFLLAVTLAGGTVAAIWLGTADSTPTRIATCPVWLDDDALRIAADAGLSLKHNVALRFPVVRAALADGGLSFDLPPGFRALRGLVEVRDWAACDLDAVATFPAVAARWDAGVPFVIPGAASKKWCRARFDAGVMCPLLDGGSFGDRNVSRCSERIAAQCERVGSGVIQMGEDPEKDIQ